MTYRFLEHTADVKFRADGITLEDMFVSAFDAFNETVRGDIKILEQEERVFELEGKGNTDLLYVFLEEFLVLLDGKDFLAASVKDLKIEDGKLRCVVVGDKAENYVFTNDVKAITFSEMFVRRSDDGWECQVVLDV